MEIIKEYTQVGSNYYFSIRSNTYSNSLGYFEELFSVARNDFKVYEQDVFIVIHSGIRYKHTYGIRFSIPVEFVKDTLDYVNINKLEDIL